MISRVKTLEETRRDALSALLVAESEFLQCNGWCPLSPGKPGDEIRWSNPRTRVIFSQAHAVACEKGHYLPDADA